MQVLYKKTNKLSNMNSKKVVKDLKKVFPKFGENNRNNVPWNRKERTAIFTVEKILT